MTLKKALVAITVVAMLFGMVGTAFAGSAFTDVAGTKYVDASGRLAALSILKGYEDGSFKPDGKITRAEFAAVAVRSLGLDSAAGYSKVDTKFADVKGSHWAAGYVNIAVDQGILKGYPDGTFKPDNNVTYAEALAMVVRMLGYEPSISGIWPANYIAKAAQIGFTKGTSFTADAPAIRGDVALFVDSAVTKPLMVQTGWGQNATYGVDTNKSLLKDNLGADSVEGVLVDVPGAVFTANSLKTTQIMVGASTLDLQSGVDASALVGHKVKAWKTTDGVFFVEDETPAASVVKDKIKEVGADYVKIEGATTGTSDDVKYTVASPTIAVNKISGKALTDLVAGYNVTLVLNSDGKVQYIDAINLPTSYVVTEVKASDNVVKYFGTSASITSLNLTDKKVIIVRNGKKASLADVAKDDVLAFANNGSGDQYYVEAVANKVTGKISQATATGSAITDYKLVVNGTGYSVGSGITYTSDNNTTVSTPGSTADIDALVAKDATILLDRAGKVRHVNYSSTATSSYALVVTIPWDVATADGTTKYIKVLKADGTTATYAIASDVTGTIPGSAKTLAKFTLNSDGKINAFQSVTSTNVTGGVPNKDYGYITDGASNRYYVASDTVIFDATAPTDVNGNATKATATTWANINQSSSVEYTLVTDSTFTSRAKVIVVTGGSVASSSISAIFKSRFVDADSVTNLVVDVNGTETTYKLASSAIVSSLDASNTGNAAAPPILGLAKNDYVTITLDASGKASTVTESVYGATGVIPTTNGIDTVAKSVYLGSTWYQVNDSTLIYDVTGDTPAKADFATLAGGQTIQIWTKTDVGAESVLKMVKITAKP